MKIYVEKEVLAQDVTAEINKQEQFGNEFVQIISERNVPQSNPDARGMSYGGQHYKTLLFRREVK